MNVAAPDRPVSVPAGGLAEFVARLFVAAGVPASRRRQRRRRPGRGRSRRSRLAWRDADRHVYRAPAPGLGVARHQGRRDLRTAGRGRARRRQRARPAHGDAGDGHRDRQGAPVRRRHRRGPPRLSLRRGGPLRASCREGRLRRHRHVQYAASDAGAGRRRTRRRQQSARHRGAGRRRDSRSCSTWRRAKPPWARSAWRRRPRKPFRRPGP